MSPSADRTDHRPAVAGQNGHASVRLSGELDLATIDAVTAELELAVGDGHRDVVVDLTDVSYLDCATLGAVLRVRDLLAVNGHGLTLRSPQHCVRRLLELCSVDSLVERQSSGPAERPHAMNALATWIEVPPSATTTAAVVEHAPDQPVGK